MDPVTLEVRGVYRLRARNIRYGVWDGRAFVGLREKGLVRLDSELPYEAGPPFGTARAEALVARLPAGIPIELRLGSKDHATGRPVAFDRPRSEGGRGWYWLDTDEDDDAGMIPSHAVIRVVQNDALFFFMVGVEAAEGVMTSLTDYRDDVPRRLRTIT